MSYRFGLTKLPEKANEEVYLKSIFALKPKKIEVEEEEIVVPPAEVPSCLYVKSEFVGKNELTLDPTSAESLFYNATIGKVVLVYSGGIVSHFDPGTGAVTSYPTVQNKPAGYPNLGLNAYQAVMIGDHLYHYEKYWTGSVYEYLLVKRDLYNNYVAHAKIESFTGAPHAMNVAHSTDGEYIWLFTAVSSNQPHSTWLRKYTTGFEFVSEKEYTDFYFINRAGLHASYQKDYIYLMADYKLYALDYGTQDILFTNENVGFYYLPHFVRINDCLVFEEYNGEKVYFLSPSLEFLKLGGADCIEWMYLYTDPETTIDMLVKDPAQPINFVRVPGDPASVFVVSDENSFYIIRKWSVNFVPCSGKVWNEYPAPTECP